MSQLTGIRDLYQIETDACDWPKGLPDDEKKHLTRIVLDVLERTGPLLTYELHDVVRRSRETVEFCPTFSRALLLDWTYACIVRAARAADAEQRWHAPARHHLSDEEMDALDKFAAEHGRNWKSELRKAWAGSKPTDDLRYAVLSSREIDLIQRLRTAEYFGDKGLDKYKPL